MSHKKSGIEFSEGRFLTEEEIKAMRWIAPPNALNASMVTSDDLPTPMPIEPFPTRKIDVHSVPIRALPDYALGQPPDRVTVGLLDRAGLLIVDTITYTRGAAVALATVVRLILIYQSLKEGPMKILKFIWRGTKLIGATFAAGSVFAGFVPADVAVYIVAAAVAAEGLVVIIGDVLDNKKLDGSFKPDAPDTEAKTEVKS